MEGLLRKMPVALEGDEVQYLGMIGQEKWNVNELVGNHIELQFSSRIFCPSCSKQVKKLYQGFCYTCFTEAPQASPCIINPELCEAHLGKGRDVEWEQKYHNQPHSVYFALSSGVKVGVTREVQIPTRWIDQGASFAQAVCKVPYRQLAGEIEVMLKDHFSDKTNWRRMLKNEVCSMDIEDLVEELFDYLPEDYHDFICEPEEWQEIRYPHISFPDKVKSLSFDKTREVGGKLIAIKGQYLLFEGGDCLNIRKHEGYEVRLNC